MLSKEELEDLSGEFSLEHQEELDALEDGIVEAGRNGYDEYMKAWESMKAFCLSAGEGGRYYFKQIWENDPLKTRLKMEKDGPQYSDIVSMLKERGPSETKDIYVLVFGADYKGLQKLVRKGEVCRIEGSHVYHLPDQDVSEIVADLRKKEEEARRNAEEFEREGPPELTIPSADELWEKAAAKIEEGLRREGATEEQIDQVFGRKKRRGLFSIFKKK